MTWKELFLIFLPVSLITFFLKAFVSSFFLFYPGDILFALAIATISLVNFNLPSILFLMFLGLLRGIDTIRLEPLWMFFFVVCLYSWGYTKRFFSFRETKNRLYAWLGYCLIYGVLQLLIYFSFLESSLGFRDYFIIFIKWAWLLFTTYLWILLLYKVLKHVFQT